MRGESELYRDKIEVSLDGRQVFYLFFGGAVIASMVFVLGVMVGRRLEARGQLDSQASAAELAKSDPLAALDMLASGGGDDLSFTDRLTEDQPDTPAPPLTAKPEAKGEADAKAKAEADAEAKAKADAEAKADAKAKAEAEAAKKAAAGKKLAAEKDKAKKPAPAPGNFTLQLSSFQSEGEADAFYDQLRSAGYRPYVVRADVPDKGTWYRVRLGKYATYDDAVAAKGNFEKRQKIIAYVTRVPRR